MRILAVDPGEVRIGLAISDPTGTIARPLCVLRHRSRAEDAAAILSIAMEEGVGLILVGIALDQDGGIGPQARKAMKLQQALESGGSLPVDTWDESGSTLAAIQNKPGKSARDAQAAAFTLQDYLNAKNG